MSRSLTLTLAASVAVIALLAVAGRECFDGHCQLPGMAEHLAPVTPTAVAQAPLQALEKHAANAAAESAAREATAPIALAPLATAPPIAVSPVAISPPESPPQNMVTVADATPTLATPVDMRPQEQAFVRGPRILRVSMTSPSEAEEVKSTRIAEVALASDPRPMHVASVSPFAETVGAIERRRLPRTRVLAARGRGAPVYGGEGILIAGVGLDPAWKPCQIDERGYEHDYYLCGPYSYHPYGAYGYRPYGTYAEYRSPPVYVIGPSAKIIQVRTRN